jgi:CRISPR-associated protein Csd2
MKHRVDHGLYLAYGAINPQLATKTGFSDADAAAFKEALVHIFDNDASSARPEGSMEVVAVVWWEHSSKAGQFSSSVVHRSLVIEPKVPDPRKLDDYSITLNRLDGLNPEIIPSGAPIATGQ